MMSSIGIHQDERYYPNPHQFNPDNFSKEARQSRSPYTFLGFGQGPRACIGMRFALLEAKVAIAMVMQLRSFSAIGVSAAVALGVDKRGDIYFGMRAARISISINQPSTTKPAI